MRVSFLIKGEARKYLCPQRSPVGEVVDGMTYTHESHLGLGWFRDSVCGISSGCFYWSAIAAEEFAFVAKAISGDFRFGCVTAHASILWS